ncbi:UDP-glucose/GDP-mannose dehydrogenase family protein [Planomicrobium sp. CPCC 101079]|uniref:UDP-glucose dehydrogenase family protein n=1 Tax=Planomicrobium sp. CPCC 101079 TaxID=2599618 RepID=UPI0011B7CCF3|nr:UDP-glucose/GDP-mannose dehydrogenase family protein [Planomicrobium sp. CPCC 101079]TWT03594.1 UDP-glucose/GDP-mannose dehydrogenase family protein [Planomicrobium sp. CPCC 101079]
MKIAVVGTGYVGLVTGVSLSEIGHIVTCIDIDEAKVEKMRTGFSPIYEPGLSELMAKNIAENRLFFTTEHQEGFKDADVIYIAVGTPENADGSANLRFVEQVAKDIAMNISQDTVVVTKSTVPVGTNDKIKQIIHENLANKVKVDIVSNPEFLKEGSAIHDSFNGDRIVIGSDSDEAADILIEINKPFGVPVYKTDIKSAEMIKYASNAFLATKISFINEISNICELLDANVEDVALGMGLDQRIGSQFLKAGIGYGGSCFPKDTKALIQIAGNVDYDFELLKGVVNVNKKQQGLLLKKLNDRFTSLQGKRIAVLGLAFKPNTDDMREAASILVTDELIKQGAEVIAYDPIAMDNAKTILNSKVQYASSVKQAIEESDAVLIVTEWDEIKNIDLNLFKTMKYPLVIDGRNCFALDFMKEQGIEYHSVGRPSIVEKNEIVYV